MELRRARGHLDRSVLVEDSTFTNNQQSAIKVGTGSGSAFPGVTVRRTTIAENGNGISANQGWMKVEDSSLIRDSRVDGLWFNLTNSYGGVTSVVRDSEIRNNDYRGIYMQVDSGLGAAYWPHGNRNNMYGNVSRQLDALNTKRVVDWKHNYWGEGVYHQFNRAGCLASGEASRGHLGFRSSSASPPEGPVSWNVYYVLDPGFTACSYDKVDIGPIEYSPFSFRGPVGMAIGQAIGSCAGRGAFAENASTCMSDPVNSATGSFTHEVSDLALPGIGVSFELVRSYNSLDPTSGTLGQGWAHSYSASLSIRTSGDITARAGSGQQLEFVRNPDGSYTAADGGRATLTSVSGGYELKSFDQLRYGFDTAGKLTSLLDRNSKGLTLAYDGNGRLATITDAANRQITLTHDATSGLLTQVAAPGGRTVSYAYTNGRLTSVTDAAGKVWRTPTRRPGSWRRRSTRSSTPSSGTSTPATGG